jgi:hypothetical protein
MIRKTAFNETYRGGMGANYTYIITLNKKEEVNKLERYTRLCSGQRSSGPVDCKILFISETDGNLSQL